MELLVKTYEETKNMIMSKGYTEEEIILKEFAQETTWAEPSALSALAYQPLDASREQIRLFCLDINDRGLLRGHLQHFSIGMAPEYRALSYTWGKADVLHAINVDEQAFMVRQNLFDFLQLYASRHLGEWIWIDQICIAQDDVQERNQQVGLMSQIYRKAREIIIWLVPAQQQMRETEVRLQTMWRIYRRAREVLDWLKSAPYMLHSGQCSAACQQDHYKRGVGGCVWMARLVNNEYWYRVWILQEVVLGHARKIWYGLSIMDWSDLNAIVLLEHQGYDTRIPSQLRWLDFCISHADGMRLISFDTAVQTSTLSACLDPRDKVYGIQALLPDTERVKVDYNKSIKAVFIEAVIMLATTKIGRSVVAKNSAYLAQAMGLSLRHVDCIDGPVRELMKSSELLSFFDERGDRRVLALIYVMLGEDAEPVGGRWILSVPEGFQEWLERDLIEV